MTFNIFQVLKETDLDEIMNDHNQNLVVVMFSTKTCRPCMRIKPKFVDMAKENGECFFVYIDLNNFENTEYKYTKTVEATPKFSYYFNNVEIADVMGADESVVSKTLSHLKNKISVGKKQLESETQTTPTTTQNKKVPVLETHTKTEVPEVQTKVSSGGGGAEQAQTGGDAVNVAKKQEQMKKIQELNQLKYLMEMQRLYKAQAQKTPDNKQDNKQDNKPVAQPVAQPAKPVEPEAEDEEDEEEDLDLDKDLENDSDDKAND